ncbi:hypothetical protein Tco_0091616 [Tanacetum coccineum]
MLNNKLQTDHFNEMCYQLLKLMVGDEAVHKELGDRIERAATTASSLEAEQDSVNAVRHQLVLPVQVPAAEVNPIIYTSCIQQFWATTNVKMVNGVRQLQALIDKKKIIITESSIRSDLHLEDAEVFINQQLGDMSHHKKIYVNPSHTKKFFANMKRAGKDFSGRITPLFDTMMVQASEEVGEDSDHPTDSNQIPIVLDLEKAKSDQAIEIASLKKRVDKLEKRRKFRTIGLKRLKKVGAASRIESSNDSLGAQEDASKQRRRIKDIDADAEMFVDATTGEKDEQSTKLDDSTTGEAVISAGVEDSAHPTIPTTVEETLAQTLMEIKAAKPKAKGIVFHDLEKQVSKPTVSVIHPSIKEKGKGIMQEPERPLTKKDQVALDEDLARNIQAQLDAEIIEEERIERKKQEEANISLIESWENT